MLTKSKCYNQKWICLVCGVINILSLWMLIVFNKIDDYHYDFTTQISKNTDNNNILYDLANIYSFGLNEYCNVSKYKLQYLYVNGLYNTGTNVLYKLLFNNCFGLESPVNSYFYKNDNQYQYRKQRNEIKRKYIFTIHTTKNCYGLQNMKWLHLYII